MVDLNNRISYYGTIAERGTESINELKRTGEQCGTFMHNDIDIVVYHDSTVSELCYQYDLKMKG